MFSFRASNFFCLIPAAIFALNNPASANTCTDAYFKLENSKDIHKIFDIKIDSTYSKDSELENYIKYFYSNEILDSIKTTSLFQGETNSSTIYFYSDTNETVLKKQNLETITHNCSNQDTICFKFENYRNGEVIKNGQIKATNNYVSKLYFSNKLTSHYEYILKQDSVILKRTSIYESDTSIIKTFYVADSTDESKCYNIEENGEIQKTLLYSSNEKGYSMTTKEGDFYYSETFVFNEEQNITTLHKTVKPVKISPKARYFDLLGRYKFTK